MFFIILGIVFILYYAGMALFVGHGSNFYLVWLLGGAALIVYGYLLRKGKLRAVPVFLKRGVLAALLLGG